MDVTLCVCIYVHIDIPESIAQYPKYITRFSESWGKMLVIYYKNLLKQHWAIQFFSVAISRFFFNIKRKERVKIKATSNLILQSLFKNVGFTIFYFFIDFFHVPFISFITEKWETVILLYMVELKINILNTILYLIKVTFLWKLHWSVILFTFKILYLLM